MRIYVVQIMCTMEDNDITVSSTSCNALVLGTDARGSSYSLIAVNAFVKDEIDCLNASYKSLLDILGFELRYIL